MSIFGIFDASTSRSRTLEASEDSNPAQALRAEALTPPAPVQTETPGTIFGQPLLNPNPGRYLLPSDSPPPPHYSSNWPAGGPIYPPTDRTLPASQAPPHLVTIPWQVPVPQTDIKIPILRFGEAAQQNATETAPANSPLAQMYLKARDSVVTVYDSTNHVSGTGFFVSSDGKVVTDNHVIERHGALQVITADGTKYDAHIVKARPTADLAELQVDQGAHPQKFQPLPIANNTANIAEGTKLYTVGHPNAWPATYLSPGQFRGYEKRSENPIVSGANPEQTMISSWMHTEPGNSGSPVLDASGKVVGVADYASSMDLGLTTAEEVHTLIGDKASTSLADYIVPRDLHFGRSVSFGIVTGLLGAKLLTDTAKIQANKRPGMLGLTLTSALGASNAFMDFPYLQEALKTGTRAEKIDAGIDAVSDTMMMSGILGVFDAKLRLPLTAVQMAGAGIKSLNDLLSDRKF